MDTRTMYWKTFRSALHYIYRSNILFILFSYTLSERDTISSPLHVKPLLGVRQQLKATIAWLIPHPIKFLAEIKIACYTNAGIDG